MLGLAQDFKKANLLTLSLSQVSTLYFSIPSLLNSYNTLPTWIPANVIIKVTNNLHVAKLKGLFLVLILLLHLTLRTTPYSWKFCPSLCRHSHQVLLLHF